MESTLEPYSTKRRRLSLLNCHNRLFVLLGVLSLLFACQQAPEPTPIVITEVVQFDDGEEIVITRVLTPTVEAVTPSPEPTIPVDPTIISLDVGITRGFSPFDPQRVTDQNTLNLVESFYAGLTNFNHRSNEIDPELAISWETSIDGRIWVFDLRTDLFWVQPFAPSSNLFEQGGDGQLVNITPIRPVDANDVVFAIRRACNPATRAPDIFVLFIIEGCAAVNGLVEASSADLETIGVRAINDTRVEFRLTEPAPYFESLTSLPIMRPIPRERFEDEENDWLDPEFFVTSGPFVLSPLTDPEREPAPVTVLQRNSQWPSDLNRDTDNPEKGNVQLVNLFLYSSRTAAYLVWDEKRLDVVDLPFPLIEEFLDSPNPPEPALKQEVFYLGFNHDSPIFGVPEVRRAFATAIDRERLLLEVYGERGEAMKHFLPPGVLHAPPIDEAGKGFGRDFARLQMAASGFGSCRLLGPIEYLVSSSDVALQHAETLVDMWVENLDCDPSQFIIEQVQFGTLLANTRATGGDVRPDLFDLGWASFYPDPQNWFDSVLHCDRSDNRPKRPCEDVDQLIDAAATERDFEERTRIYRRIENFFFGEEGTFPIVPLYVRGDFRAEQNWVSEAYPPTFGGEQYETYFIDQPIKELEQQSR